LETMQSTVCLAVQHHVKVGAHPSYPDRENFGRTSQAFDSASYIEQIQTFNTIAHGLNQTMNHIKPHGALYNDAMKNEALLIELVRIQAEFWPKTPLVLQGGVDDQRLQALANQNSVSICFEYFADRAYQDSGLLRPRNESGAVHSNSKCVLEQFKALKQAQKGHTVCFHSDNPASIEALKAL